MFRNYLKNMFLLPQLDVHSMNAMLFNFGQNVYIFADLMNHIWDDISNA